LRHFVHGVNYNQGQIACQAIFKFFPIYLPGPARSRLSKEVPLSEYVLLSAAYII
jgi:hypothetical protein